MPSQAGQDRFALHVLRNATDLHTYIDVGANDPFHNNNTDALEAAGFVGLSVDACDFSALHSQRRNPFELADAKTCDWKALALRHDFLQFPLHGYLSFDVDDATVEALRNFPFDLWTFAVVTVEHDFYRVGEGTRAFVRELFRKHGYHLLCADVACPPVGSFEDWFVHPNLVDLPSLSHLQSSDLPWTELVSRIS